MKTHCISFATGLAAGIFGGLIGVGGGLIMIPLLIGVLKLSQHQAHGTSLVALVFTGIGGAITYGLNGSVDLTAALLLAATAMVTARAGARYAHVLAGWKLRKAFGVFLIFSALILLSKPYLAHFAGTVPGYGKIIVFLATGAVTGFFSGMMGVGGGTIMVPAMVLLAGFSQHLAQGTSLLVMVPAGAVGAFTHRKLGNVAQNLLIGLAPGILLGAFIGGSFAHVMPENILRIIFILVLIFMGLRYIRARETE